MTSNSQLAQSGNELYFTGTRLVGSNVLIRQMIKIKNDGNVTARYWYHTAQGALFVCGKERRRTMRNAGKPNPLPILLHHVLNITTGLESANYSFLESREQDKNYQPWQD